MGTSHLFSLFAHSSRTAGGQPSRTSGSAARWHRYVARLRVRVTHIVYSSMLNGLQGGDIPPHITIHYHTLPHTITHTIPHTPYSTDTRSCVSDLCYSLGDKTQFRLILFRLKNLFNFQVRARLNDRPRGTCQAGVRHIPPPRRSLRCERRATGQERADGLSDTRAAAPVAGWSASYECDDGDAGCTGVRL